MRWISYVWSPEMPPRRPPPILRHGTVGTTKELGEQPARNSQDGARLDENGPQASCECGAGEGNAVTSHPTCDPTCRSIRPLGGGGGEGAGRGWPDPDGFACWGLLEVESGKWERVGVGGVMGSDGAG